LFAGEAARKGWPIVYPVVLLAMWVFGFVNALVHGKDAWASMPAGLYLSVIVTLLALVEPGSAIPGSGQRDEMKRSDFLMSSVVVIVLSACGNEPAPPQYGPNPELPEPRRGLLPRMGVLAPTSWGNDLPTTPPGYGIEAIATDLQIPRQTLVLPNGDILVAEGSGGSEAPALRPKDVIANYIRKQGKSSVKGGDRLTLLRDGDGNGSYETRGIFADALNAPYGLALVNGALYVANQDSLVRFDYRDGQSRASGPPTKITELPSVINHHWTKAMTASADGRFLYVGIGSNSNITERGMDAEVDRAMVWQIDAQTGAHKPYATGIRNPTALAIQPGTDVLWAVVNERDEIGPNLVPDYLTSVREGGFYGWPYSYWGQTVDPRAQPQDPQKVASAIRPD
jgi:glucose/arabinose dehydrogenase